MTKIENKETGGNNDLKLRKRLVDVVCPDDADIGRDELRLAMLNGLSQSLLGCSLDTVLNNSSSLIVPYIKDGIKKHILELSSASTASNAWETEKSMSQSGDPRVIDMPVAISTRDITGLISGDTVVVITPEEKEVAGVNTEIDVIDLNNEIIIQQEDGEIVRASDFYYKQDAILMLLALDPENSELAKLLNIIKENPVIDVYSTDEETVLMLTVLAQRANVDQLQVNTNSPEVTHNLTDKSIRYPSVDDAWIMDVPEDHIECQRKEWQLSYLSKTLKQDNSIDVLPGYSLDRSDDYEEFKSRAYKALFMHYHRYGFTKVWRKPARGTDGGNQGEIEMHFNEESGDSEVLSGIVYNPFEKFVNSLSNNDQIDKLLTQMHESGGNWVIEGYTEFIDFPLDIEYGDVHIYKDFNVNPSVHIANGVVGETLTLQITDEKADGTKQWGGNLVLDRHGWSDLMRMSGAEGEELDDLINSYDLCLENMKRFTESVNNTDRYKNGYVRGGYDVGIATLSGKFKNGIYVILQDNNARANGAESAYALANNGGEGVKKYAVTRNVSPLIDYGNMRGQLFHAVENVKVQGINIDYQDVSLIGLSEGWGQFGIKGDDPIDILKKCFIVEHELRQIGAIN
jgi:hypothetical protein